MTEEVVASPQPLIDADPVPPAPGAEEQKPTPAAGAEEQKPEAAETPEQQEARKESRRARQARRHAMELGEARAEARLLRERLAAAEGKSQPRSSGEPQRDQFEDYEGYLRAVARYEAKQEAEAAKKSIVEETRGQAQQALSRAELDKREASWAEREKVVRAAHSDYESAVQEYVADGRTGPLAELAYAVREFITESDQGPALLHYLATHDAEHDRLTNLSPARQLIELGKLEDKVKAPPPKETSAAPPPVKPVGQGKSGTHGYSENMSDAEYKAWRKAQGARWAQS